MPVGQIIMIINVFILLRQGLYSVQIRPCIRFFILHSGKSDGYCGRGLDESKSVTIISNEYEEISSAIMRVWAADDDDLCQGRIFERGYADDLLRHHPAEIAKLKTVVQEIDKNAFISIQNVADVLGGSMAKSDIH